MSNSEPPISCIDICAWLLLFILSLIAFFNGLLYLAIICWCSMHIMWLANYIIRKKGWELKKKKP